jgi:Aldos-2-ulose dehydratase/isomerase (AUDH) Cupin domain
MSMLAEIKPSAERTGLDVVMGSDHDSVLSPVWNIGAWSVRFVCLKPRGQFEPDRSMMGAVHIKVVAGRLANIDRGAYPRPYEIRSTLLNTDHVEAGPDGALFAVFTATGDIGAPVRSLDQLRYRGPGAEALDWCSFESRYAAATPHFDGLDAHLSAGFHLLDDDGAEIAYVYIWAAGKGVDMSTHNHSRKPTPTAPAFAEVHWVMHNGTGLGGMYLTPEPGGTAIRDRFPMQQGEEHGPFFAVDAASGLPMLRLNGAVDYPWHGWEAGIDDESAQRYDVVVAFEITAPYAQTLRPD